MDDRLSLIKHTVYADIRFENDMAWLIAEVERLRDESIRHAECCVKAAMYDRIMGRDND